MGSFTEVGWRSKEFPNAIPGGVPDTTRFLKKKKNCNRNSRLDWTLLFTFTPGTREK
jgi:hypothetical protein